MRTATKIWLITAAALVLGGCLIMGGTMSMLKWDFTKLSTNKYEENTYELSDTFTKISMDTDTADITFALSADGKCKVICYESEKDKNSVAVQDDTLTIQTSKKAWYDYIGINLGAPKITVYLPQAEYTSLVIHEDTGDITIPKDFSFGSVDIALSTGQVSFAASASGQIKIKSSTGNIQMDDTSAGELDLTVSTGKVTASNVVCLGDFKLEVDTGKTQLTNVQCKNFTTTGDTGKITMCKVVASEKFSIERSTGDVTFDSCDAAEILVETSTGDVTGSFLTDKIFLIQTDTGKKAVPESVTGGKCKITTSTGDIKITIG